MEWDAWSSEDIPVCTSLKQLLQFEQEHAFVADYWEQSSIVRHTGCLTPCRYTEYKLAKDPIRFKDDNMTLNIVLSSTDILTRTEKKIYSGVSFVAEFGGALGLFLGFSFLMVWDGTKAIILNLVNCFKRRYGRKWPTAEET